MTKNIITIHSGKIFLKVVTGQKIYFFFLFLKTVKVSPRRTNGKDSSSDV